MDIRKATLLDAEAIGHILKESYNISSVEEGAEAFRLELQKSHHFIVAVEENVIVGLTSWTMHGLPKHGLFELDRIAVLPDQKGRGVAKRLFNALIEDARNFFNKKQASIRKLYILTHDSNARAQAFYEKMGLKKEIVIKDHYYKGVDEVLYSKFFKETSTSGSSK
ncbi:MAG: GNAT family N-acetyltransferase [Nanoarchaeota archaeon]